MGYCGDKDHSAAAAVADSATRSLICAEYMLQRDGQQYVRRDHRKTFQGEHN